MQKLTVQKRVQRHKFPIEEENFKWLKALEESLRDIPDTIQKVTVGDREVDIYERFHFTLKSGCRIEELQLETSER